ncbi:MULTISPECIES: hypothetical protein [unclassified Bradyrhizobium]|uniref:hypothetical protein n=1 Tax=unclassified Bradyrhizobium TaxID=2631580 RepID=UPI001BA8757C|nr:MULTISPECIES: hypothetical protein [unclassified Bradyrhizobium]MBR1205532.1 hypothetical protein [Bradyrhizobium sp. AUGA SZCCT0124]MBR1314019.1 hypothetical protein [Bradyrhizobium sp. AUGA SZCCT0051]MBR1337859.1 hypothetical protein [Bradyrhizobium sp. AUGA SZCCT0105]MBR1360100.1 hypothetical protein [Bradyrhizobium sp. AUGA SZCCT0045]
MSVLAARPEQRIPLEEVSREVKRMIAAGDAATKLKRSSELGDADVFQSGWASINEAGLQITDSGLALWRSLEASRVEQELSEQELGEQNLKEREPGERQTEPVETVAADPRDAISDAVAERPDAIDRQVPRVMEAGLADRTTLGTSRAMAAPDPPARAPIIPEPAFGSIHEPDRNVSRLSHFVKLLGTGIPRFARARRRRSEDDVPDRKAVKGVGMPGLAVACLSLISVVACVAAAIALGQITSLKSDNATLRRELIPLRERLVRLEQDAAKREAAQQDEAQERVRAEKKASDAGSEHAALNLSREEIQLIREYIKAAPSAGAAGPPINVGDPVTGGMIPLPSSLIEKVPRLVGARFATRNGVIVISTRNSRRVDAVLTPN